MHKITWVQGERGILVLQRICKFVYFPIQCSKIKKYTKMNWMYFFEPSKHKLVWQNESLTDINDTCTK